MALRKEKNSEAQGGGNDAAKNAGWNRKSHAMKLGAKIAGVTG
jgi:hypothetical protein